MEPNLLEIVFNETYYLSNVGTISNVVTSPFDHYLDYGMKTCIDPCAEFESYNKDRKAINVECLYKDWLSSSTLIDKSFYLKVYMKDGSNKQNDPLKSKKVKEYFSQYANSNLEFTEQFIRSFENKAVDNIFVMLLNSIDHVKGSMLQEDTLSLFEKTLTNSKHIDISNRMLIKLLDYIEEYDYNYEREEFISSIISKTKFSDEALNLVSNFYRDASLKGKIFNQKVYQNFENYIESAKEKTAILEILSYGAKLTDYLPSKNLLDLFLENLNLAKDSGLFVQAICKILVSLLENTSKENIAVIENVANKLLKEGHTLSNDFIQKIFNYYANTQESFSDIIIRIIEDFYESSRGVIQDFANKQLLELIDVNLSNEKHLKDLIHITDRIFSVMLNLPNNIPTTLIKIASIDNFEIKKLTIRLFFKISSVYTFEENKLYEALFNQEDYIVPENLEEFIKYYEEKNQIKSDLTFRGKLLLKKRIKEYSSIIKDSDLKYIAIENIDKISDVFKFLEDFNYSDSVLLRFYKNSENLQQSNSLNENDKKLLGSISEFVYSNYIYIEKVAAKSLNVKFFIKNEPIFVPSEFEETEREENEQILANLILNIFPDSLVQNIESLNYEDKNIIDIQNLNQIKTIIESAYNKNINQDYIFKLRYDALENYIHINSAKLDDIKIHSKVIPNHLSFEKQIKEILYKNFKNDLLEKGIKKIELHDQEEFIKYEENLGASHFTQLMINSVNSNRILDIFDKIIADNERDKLNLINFIIGSELDKNFLASILDEGIEIEAAYSKIITFILKQKLLSFPIFDLYENYIESFIDSMLLNDWNLYHLSKIVMLINNENAQHMVYALEKIHNNKLTPYTINKEGYSALEVMQNYESENWSIEIWKIAAQNQFWIAYTLEQLIAKVEILNQENPEILELVKSDYYKNKVEEIHKARDRLHYKIQICYDKKPEQINNNIIYVSFYDDKIILETDKDKYFFERENSDRIKNILLYQQPIHPSDLKSLYDFMLEYQYANIEEWQSENFSKWFENLEYPTDDNIAHFIAVLDYGLHKTIFKGKYFLRNLQHIALLNHFKASKGLIQEVATSDGKTAIIACILMFELLKKRKPDSITSSQELATRDTEDTQSFFDLFNVTSGSITSENGKILGFENDVVRGDMVNFGGSFLRDQNDGNKKGRLFSSVIIDEVDYTTLDSVKTVIKINSITPGFSYFQQIYTYMKAYFPWVPYGITSCDLASDKFDGNECDQAIRVKLLDFIQKDILDDKKANSEKPVVFFSGHKKFVNDQSANWVSSLISAEMEYEEDTNYILYDTRLTNKLNPYKSIAPVTMQTGSINNRQVWANGIHQFLALIHNIALFPENLVSLFASYYTYLKYYGSNLYGLTGTTGDAFQREFVKRHFDVNYAILPTFKEKRFTQYPEIITDDYKDFLNQLKRAVITSAIRDNRACLVLSKTIKDVRILKNLLSEIEDLNILTYKYGYETERALVEGKRIDKHTGVIATNIAGRGSNILPNSEVAEFGGVDVIFTFFPDNLKVELQGIYRAARAGDMGSAQLIFKRELEHKNLEIADLYKERDKKEKESLLYFETCSLQASIPFDKNSEKTRNLMLNLVSPTGYYMDLSLREDPAILETNKIYLSSNDDNIYLHVPNPKLKENKININYELKLLDPQIYNSVKKILNDKTVVNFYNLESLNLIHFIAANYSSSVPDKTAYNYVNKFYTNAIEACEKESQFCYVGDVFAEKRQEYVNKYFKRNNVTSLNEEEKQIFKYALWQEYLAVFNKNSELAQVRSNLDMFFYYNYIPYNNFMSECSIDRPEEAKAKFAELNANLEKNYNILEQTTLDKFSKTEFFSNPNYIQNKAFQYHDIYFSKIAQEQVFLSFSKNPEFMSQAVFKNSKHMNEAVRLMNVAINQDPHLAWAQHSNIVLIRTQKANHADNIGELNEGNVEKWNQIKVDNVKNAHNSVRLLIDEKNRYQSSFMSLATSGMLDRKSELFYQFTYNNAYYDKAIENANKTAIAFNNALKEPKKGMRIAKTYTAFDLAFSLNQTEVFEKSLKLLNSTTSLNAIVLNQTNSSLQYDTFNRLDASNGFVFTDYESFELEEEDDTFEKVFIGIMGVVQIVAGFTILATFGGTLAFFANSLGLSTILSGFGDIVTVADSVVNGYSLDLNSYFQSKAVSYAVAVVTAGIMQGLGANVLPKEAFGVGGALNKAVTFKFALAMQAVNMGIGYAANYAAKEYADSNRGDANADSESMSNEIINDYSNQLFAIYVADELDSEVDYFSNLQNGASSARYECDKRFNDPASTIFKSSISTVSTHMGAAAGGVLGAGAAAFAGAAIGATYGAFKYYEYAGEYRDNYSPYLNSAFNSAKAYLKNAQASEVILSRNLNLEYSESVTTTIMNQMKKDNFIVDNQVNFEKCKNVSNYNAKNYEVNIEIVAQQCNLIYIGFNNYKTSLKQTIKQEIKNGMTGTLSSDIASPVFNSFGHFTYETIKSKYEKYKKTREAEKQAEEQRRFDESLRLLRDDNYWKFSETVADDSDGNVGGEGKPKKKPYGESSAKNNQQKPKHDSTRESKQTSEPRKGKQVYGPREPFADAFDKLSERIDSLPISKENKNTAKTKLYNDLRDVSKAPIENQVQFMHNYLNSLQDPLNFVSISSETQAARSQKFQKEVDHFIREYRKERELIARQEATKSPETRAKEANEHMVMNDEEVRHNKEWMKADAVAERKAHEDNLIKDYKKSTFYETSIKWLMRGISAVFGPFTLRATEGAIKIQEVITAGDDKLEILNKMKEYDNQPTNGNYPY